MVYSIFIRDIMYVYINIDINKDINKYDINFLKKFRSEELRNIKELSNF